MFKKARLNASKLIAGVLAVLILLNVMPGGVISNVFAADAESLTVKLPEGISGTVTLTDENDSEKVFIADTDLNFEVVLENLDSETTYSLVVSNMDLYKNFTKTGIVPDKNTPVVVLLSDLVEKEDQIVTFAEESITKTFGEANFAIILSTEGLGTGVKTYSSSNDKVAKVSENGTVTIVGAGTAELKVSIATDANYKSAEDTLLLTVEQAENAILKFKIIIFLILR